MILQPRLFTWSDRCALSRHEEAYLGCTSDIAAAMLGIVTQHIMQAVALNQLWRPRAGMTATMVVLATCNRHLYVWQLCTSTSKGLGLRLQLAAAHEEHSALAGRYEELEAYIEVRPHLTAVVGAWRPDLIIRM